MKTFEQYISEALVDTDQTDSGCPIKMLRGALADENSAANLYDTIVSKLSKNTGDPKFVECIKVIKEIAADERNHIGKLLYLLKELDPEAFKKTEAGLQNEE